MKTYTLTRDKLYSLLQDAVGLAWEFETAHGYDRERANDAAVFEALDGLDAEAEIAEAERQVDSEGSS